MNLALSDEQVMVRDAAADYLATASNSSAVRTAMEGERGFDPAVWSTISRDLGWCGVAIEEDAGGLGLGPMELVLIQEQAGRHLLSGPFFPTVCLAAPLIAAVGSAAAREAWLPRIAAGDCQLGMAVTDSAAGWTGQGVQVDGEQLTGHVAWALDGADGWLLPAEDAGWYWVAADAPGLSSTPLETWDLTRRFVRLELHGAQGQRIDGNARPVESADQALALARLYLAAEQLGGAQQCLDMTLAYIAERKQFGRTIASFQAIKHRCAQMMVAVEAARSPVYGAAALAAAGEDVSLDAAAARARAGEAYLLCAGEAIQLHGGVGFTWEYDPQLHFKRAWGGRHLFGDAPALRALLADQLLAA